MALEGRAKGDEGELEDVCRRRENERDGDMAIVEA